MASVAIRCSVSSTGEENSEEHLDPRICEELDKLNKASENINRIELQLEEARLAFRQLLTESTQQLDGLAKKLGSCIEKSRTYYEARFALKEAHLATQNATLRYERACSQLAAAKEMVNLAEQGYFKQSQQFDPAWQEMLNHSTMKVNESERERLESELEHMKVAQLLNEAEQRVKKLQRDWKRNIAKSRPYFEQKARMNQQMEERKKRIMQLEQQISSAKKLYAETLQNLEKISDDIHLQRRQEQRREKKARKLAQAIGNETVIYHPLMDVVSSSSDDDSGNETSGDVDSTELSVPPLVGVVAVKDLSVRQIDCIPVTDASVHLPTDDAVKRLVVEGAGQVDIRKHETSIEKSSTVAEQHSPSTADGAPSLAESTSSPVSPECDIDQMRANAAVMAAISRSKLQRISSPFLRADAFREDFSANGGSETESVSGSFVSGGLAALDDEQIESLMVDVTEYQRIVADMDTAESERYQQMALPARLRHLRDFVKFEPIWIEDDGDDAQVTAATQNCAAECCVAATRVTDCHVLADSDNVFADSDNVEFSNESHSDRHQNADAVLDKKECRGTDEADITWHPLMDNISGRAMSESNSGHE